MRKHCLGCVLKHLGSAAVLEEECRNGYPNYDFLVIGHMDQAASECMSVHPGLARVLRQHRINFQYRDGYGIPYEPLAGFVHLLEGEEEGTAGSVEVPADCLAGIDTDANGPVFDGDTRP